VKEDRDYQLIPADVDNDQAWEIRILKGEFIETVIRYGNVSIDGPTDSIRFSFTISQTADDDLTVDNNDLQEVAGKILGDLIENHIERGTISLEDK